MRTIRWGMIGCGSVCEVKSGPAFSRARNSDFAVVFSRFSEKAEDYARRHSVPAAFRTARELIGSPGIDAVYTATPPDSRRKHALLCAEHRKPAYIEKPLGRTWEDCVATARAFRASETPVFATFYRRSMLRFLKIREILASRVIGKVRGFSSVLSLAPESGELTGEGLPWRVIPEISGGGKFLDMGTPSTGSSAPYPTRGERSPTRRSCTTPRTAPLFPFSSRAGLRAGTMLFSFAAFPSDRVTVLGSEGELFFLLRRRGISLTSAGKSGTFSVPDRLHVQEPLIRDVTDKLNGKGEKSPSRLDNALRASFTAKTILAPHYGRPAPSWPDDLPAPGRRKA